MDKARYCRDGNAGSQRWLRCTPWTRTPVSGEAPRTRPAQRANMRNICARTPDSRLAPAVARADVGRIAWNSVATA